MKPLPCPFCGAAPRVYEDESGHRDSWHLQCESSRCRVQPGIMFARSREEAIEFWNNRSNEK